MRRTKQEQAYGHIPTSTRNGLRTCQVGAGWTVEQTKNCGTGRYKEESVRRCKGDPRFQHRRLSRHTHSIRRRACPRDGSQPVPNYEETGGVPALRVTALVQPRIAWRQCRPCGSLGGGGRCSVGARFLNEGQTIHVFVVEKRWHVAGLVKKHPLPRARETVSSTA